MVFEASELMSKCRYAVWNEKRLRKPNLHSGFHQIPDVRMPSLCSVLSQINVSRQSFAFECADQLAIIQQGFILQW